MRFIGTFDSIFENISEKPTKFRFEGHISQLCNLRIKVLIILQNFSGLGCYTLYYVRNCELSKIIILTNVYFFPQEELDLSAPNKTAMLSLPKEKKWQIYCSQKGSLGNDTGLSNDPEFYIEIVNRLSGLEFSHDLGMHSVENIVAEVTFQFWVIFINVKEF